MGWPKPRLRCLCSVSSLALAFNPSFRFDSLRCGLYSCVIAGRAYPCKVELKIVQDKKDAIKRDFANSDPHAAYKQLKETSAGNGRGNLDWTELPLTKATCFYAGTLPWTDPGLLAFPTARGDGLIDVIISESRNRIDLLTVRRSFPLTALPSERLIMTGS